MTTSTLTVRKRRGAYVLAGHPSALRTGVSMWRGEISTAAGSFEVTSTDRHRLGAVARVAGRPVVQLHPGESRVPGPGGPAHWSPGRCSGVLTRGANRIGVSQAGWPGAPVRVEVTGTWAELDLVVLSACFAVLSRRRRRTFTIMAIVGAIGHH
ncbi:hypothetical protein [Plantactinospora sonchi]|uniref:Uncharacterized protein n=1 Tax=Plantactinospora sonchi TaxID=1544735 RepID=A0ABU7S1K1_9ACTN